MLSSEILGFVSDDVFLRLLSKVQPPIGARVLRDIPRSRQVAAKVPAKKGRGISEDMRDGMSVLSAATLEHYPETERAARIV